MSENLAAALFAGLVAGNLQEVDELTTQKSAAGPAKKINPHSFIKSKPQPTQQNEATATIQVQAGQGIAPTSIHPITAHGNDLKECLELIAKTFVSIDKTLKKIEKHISK